MTDSPLGPSIDEFGPVYDLPAVPLLDARSAVALAISDGLQAQYASSPDPDAVVLDPGALADAVLKVIDDGGFPRIPAWDGTPRSIGGGRRAEETVAQPMVTIEPVTDDEREGIPFDILGAGYVAVPVEATCDHGVNFSARALAPVEDVEMWLLAGLAACRAAGRAPGYPTART